MDKYITDERTGLKYELVGNYYLVAGDEEQEENQHIGIWGQRYLRHIKQHKKTLYTSLLTSNKLNELLAEIDNSANDMLELLVKQMAQKQGATESLKAENQMLWVQKMNNIRSAASEIVISELIYA